MLSLDSAHRQHAEKIVVQYKVAVQLSLPFGDIDVKDPYNLLLFLLLNGKPLFPLIDAFITHYELNYAKAPTPPLFCSFFVLLRSHTYAPHTHRTRTQVAVHIADSYFKAVQGQARGGRRVGSLGTYKPSPLGGSSSGGGGDTGESQTGIDPAWSDDDFAQFVNLSKDPGEVGNRLVYLINKNKDQIPHECEVCACAVARVVCRV
jgi:hypothetical protein